MIHEVMDILSEVNSITAKKNTFLCPNIYYIHAMDQNFNHVP